ncbi:MAG TPA: hypothetical protein VGB85_04850 [Nannocystis sp.]
MITLDIVVHLLGLISLLGIVVAYERRIRSTTSTSTSTPADPRVGK